MWATCSRACWSWSLVSELCCSTMLCLWVSFCFTNTCQSVNQSINHESISQWINESINCQSFICFGIFCFGLYKSYDQHTVIRGLTSVKGRYEVKLNEYGIPYKFSSSSIYKAVVWSCKWSNDSETRFNKIVIVRDSEFRNWKSVSHFHLWLPWSRTQWRCCDSSHLCVWLHIITVNKTTCPIFTPNYPGVSTLKSL